MERDYSVTRYQIMKKGSKVAILALGGFYQMGEEVSKLYYEKTDNEVTLINPRFITSVDKETLGDLQKDHKLVITIEDGILSGGFGARIAQFYAASLCSWGGNPMERSITSMRLILKDLRCEGNVYDTMSKVLQAKLKE